MKTLYLIPTTMAPNTAHQVLAPQILEVVKHTNYYFVENIRTARRCISELKLGKVIDELVFFELDLYWVIHSGNDPLKLFAANAGRFKMWHVKDKDKRYLNNLIIAPSLTSQHPLILSEEYLKMDYLI